MPMGVQAQQWCVLSLLARPAVRKISSLVAGYPAPGRVPLGGCEPPGINPFLPKPARVGFCGL